MDEAKAFSQALPPFSEPFAEILPLPCSDRRKPRSIPAAIRALIGELGLRYRPSLQEEIEAHAGRLALLAADLSDLPPPALRYAIDRWVIARPYMPKASELAELAQQYLTAPAPGQGRKAPPPDVQCHERNLALKAAGNFRMRWRIVGGAWQALDYLEWLEEQSDEESREALARLKRERERWQQDLTP